MPRTCTICLHPERAAIDTALVAGEPYRSIAQRFAISPDATLRHKRHIPATLAKASEAAEVVQADSLLSQVRTLQSRTLAILDAAEESDRLNVAVSAIREARGNLELLAKLLGELDERPTVNITVSQEWLSLRAVIVGAVEPYPEARAAIAEALSDSH